MNLAVYPFSLFAAGRVKLASDQLEWTKLQIYPPSCQRRLPQHTVSPLTVIFGHKCHRKIPILTPHN